MSYLGAKRGRKKVKSGKFTFRVTESLRAKLEQSAKVRGRPVSEEIELRLEQSYLQGDLVTALREEIREEIRHAMHIPGWRSDPDQALGHA